MKLFFKYFTFVLFFFILGSISPLHAKNFNNIDARAKQGNIEAQFELGSMYYEGRNVVRNYAKAIEWWTIAANNGHAESHFSLGMMYGLGQGVQEDYVKAYAHFKVASIQGNEEAAANLQFLMNNMSAEQMKQADELADKILGR